MKGRGGTKRSLWGYVCHSCHKVATWSDGYPYIATKKRGDARMLDCDCGQRMTNKTNLRRIKVEAA